MELPVNSFIFVIFISFKIQNRFPGTQFRNCFTPTDNCRCHYAAFSSWNIGAMTPITVNRRVKTVSPDPHMGNNVLRHWTLIGEKRMMEIKFNHPYNRLFTNQCSVLNALLLVWGSGLTEFASQLRVSAALSYTTLEWCTLHHYYTKTLDSRLISIFKF